MAALRRQSHVSLWGQNAASPTHSSPNRPRPALRRDFEKTTLVLIRLGQAVVAADGNERNKPTNPEIRSSGGPPAHRAFKDGEAPANRVRSLP